MSFDICLPARPRFDVSIPQKSMPYQRGFRWLNLIKRIIPTILLNGIERFDFVTLLSFVTHISLAWISPAAIYGRKRRPESYDRSEHRRRSERGSGA